MSNPRAAVPRRWQRLSSTLPYMAVGGALSFAVLLALFSLRWPVVHDLPIMLYDGYLMDDLGRVPYRDFYEINAPGTMLIFAFLHRLTGGAALPLRFIDLGILAAIGAFTVVALRAHGTLSGLLAASCFAIVYLVEGPIQSLQREYLCMLPLSFSLAVLFRRDGPIRDPLSIGLVGLAAGVVLSIKPVLVLCWVPLVIFVLASRLRHDGGPLTGRRIATETLRTAIPFLAGSSIVPALLLVWMIRIGALEQYREIVRNYYPLYAELKGNGTIWHSGLADVVQRYLANPLEVVARFQFVLLSFLGAAWAWSYRERRAFSQFILVGALIGGGLLSAAVSGKFWPYHRFPVFYSMALLGGLVISRAVNRLPGESSWQGAVICLAVVVGLPLNVAGREFVEWRTGQPMDIKGGRVDLVADYLRQHVSRTETVLPLDVTSGALHAMYRDRRPLYGRFIYDHPFYHHVDRPYIQQLRKQLLEEFTDRAPDVVVRFDDTWLRTPDFPELDAILREQYELVLQRNDVSILRRRAAALASASRSSGLADAIHR
jgi:hypothetical protein